MTITLTWRRVLIALVVLFVVLSIAGQLVYQLS